MAVRRHKDDEATYRELTGYSQRVKSFNGTVRNLVNYTRVQLELDASAELTPRRIVDARVETLRKAMDEISQMTVADAIEAGAIQLPSNVDSRSSRRLRNGEAGS